MFRPFIQNPSHSSRLPLNTRLNSTLQSGIGRGSSSAITFRDLSLLQKLRRKLQESKKLGDGDDGGEVTRMRKPQPGQFDDSIEDVATMDKEATSFTYQKKQKAFQSMLPNNDIEYLVEETIDPLKKYFGSTKNDGNDQKKPKGQRYIHVNEDARRRRQESQMRKNNERPQLQPSINKKRHEMVKARDFVVEDINWDGYQTITPDFSLMIQKENELIAGDADESLELLEIKHGDYTRYLGKTLNSKILSETVSSLIGQNPSYDLKDKQKFYEVLSDKLKNVEK
nr:3200_t:CDS:2 [Entrophospora candida]